MDTHTHSILRHLVFILLLVAVCCVTIINIVTLMVISTLMALVATATGYGLGQRMCVYVNFDFIWIQTHTHPHTKDTLRRRWHVHFYHPLVFVVVFVPIHRICSDIFPSLRPNHLFSFHNNSFRCIRSSRHSSSTLGWITCTYSTLSLSVSVAIRIEDADNYYLIVSFASPRFLSFSSFYMYRVHGNWRLNAARHSISQF